MDEERRSVDRARSKTLRFLIIYLAVMTTVTFAFVGYNQQTVCSTQKSNVKNNIAINNSIVDAINQQIVIYKIILAGDSTISDFEIKKSIYILKQEKNAIKRRAPEEPRCLFS